LGRPTPQVLVWLARLAVRLRMGVGRLCFGDAAEANAGVRAV
jgi:hypothetical protein